MCNWFVISFPLMLRDLGKEMVLWFLERISFIFFQVFLISDLSILLKETRVCVCVFAKLDQFLPVRSQFDSNQHVNSVRTATFQSANFGPLLFAFYCPLLFYENKIKNE